MENGFWKCVGTLYGSYVCWSFFCHFVGSCWCLSNAAFLCFAASSATSAYLGRCQSQHSAHHRVVRARSCMLELLKDGEWVLIAPADYTDVSLITLSVGFQMVESGLAKILSETSQLVHVAIQNEVVATPRTFGLTSRAAKHPALEFTTSCPISPFNKRIFYARALSLAK